MARFPAYTYSALMDEDAELIRLLNAQAAADAAGPDEEGW
jgi:hypothetical protein